ncbi:MAG: hypothetical protein SAL07_23605 [Oscillatoria sp. PMC 1051.18]|uniref:hypothetical protein n=1 Tax=Oscillatoria salina TaxID=331517 RepID=UPI0013B743F4|nr:hypothetical protein [Oscillatoria salina]MBZ8179477.1 hypothetical protein [Oscillatoria salina IIICB1]MEC4894709.1 hypothetical protein [Oscillatoria sp. PMC 1050.18]MEC5032899.1 hypothetical protein [Oscillatoria sp. PMC 1051.18]NET89082.1 hypothetical protein [Kamptonema sp. SIO1D9]
MTLKLNKFYFLSLLLALLVGCSQNFGVTFPGERRLALTQIGELDLPTNYEDTTVYLKGQVISVAPFLESGAYLLQDTTGTIWVVTKETIPDRGDIVLIQGKLVYESIPIGEQELGELYVQQEQQLGRQASQLPNSSGAVILPERSFESQP